MAKMVVDEFVIELSLSDKITRGLTKLENKVKQSSSNIEKSLNGAFSKDFTKPLQQSLKRLEGQSKKTAQTINKNLNSISPKAVNGRRMFSGVASEARKAAAEAQRALNGIRGNGGGAGGSGRPPRGGGAGRPPVMTPQERAFSRLSTMPAFQRLQNAGGQHTIRAQELRSQAMSQLNRYGGSQSNINAILTRYQSNLQGAMSGFRASLNTGSRALNQHASMTASATSGLSGLIVGLMSVHAALEVFKQSLEAGMNRQSATTSANFVYGRYGQNASKDAQYFADTMSRQLGLGFNDTLKKMTGFVASAAPSMGVGQAQDFFKTSTTYGKLMGANPETLGRAQIALEQMASKGTVSAEELKGQLAEALPGSVELFAKAYTGSDDAKGVAKLLADMNKGLVKSADLLPKVAKAMQQQIDANGGLEAISKQTSTALGNLQGREEDWLVSFEQGYDKGFGKVLHALSDTLDNTGEIANVLGGALGFVFDSLGDLAQEFGLFFVHMDGYIIKLEVWWARLGNSTQAVSELVKTVGSLLVKFAAIEAALAGGGLFKLLGMLMGMTGAKVAGAAGGAGGLAKFGGAGAFGWMIALAASANDLTKAFQDNANDVRSFFGLDPVKQRTSEEIMKDPNSTWFDKFMHYDIRNAPGDIWKNIQDSPLAQGNFKGSVTPPPQQVQVQSKLQIANTPIQIEVKSPEGEVLGSASVDPNMLFKWEEGQNHQTSFMDSDYDLESPYSSSGNAATGY
ncbi:TPA: tape measure protein [Escherichia coli]|nr:tape measure protein [Escherichia coli]